MVCFLHWHLEDKKEVVLNDNKKDGNYIAKKLYSKKIIYIYIHMYVSVATLSAEISCCGLCRRLAVKLGPAQQGGR